MGLETWKLHDKPAAGQKAPALVAQPALLSSSLITLPSSIVFFVLGLRFFVTPDEKAGADIGHYSDVGLACPFFLSRSVPLPGCSFGRQACCGGKGVSRLSTCSVTRSPCPYALRAFRSSGSVSLFGSWLWMHSSTHVKGSEVQAVATLSLKGAKMCGRFPWPCGLAGEWSSIM